MATLTIPHNFVAGTPALASEVNANFQAIVSWTQSNIGTDNLGILSARSVALPSSPQYAILSINQTASQPALNVSNSGSDTAVTVTQGGLLATGKSVFLISDSISQTASGAAHMKMSLSGTTTIPALEIKHGVQNTLTVSRTAISTDLGITSAGTIAANALSSTTSISAASVTSTGLVTITAPVSDAVALKVKGRSSDNQSKIVLKSNDDATTYAEITSKTTGVELNLPDTADSLTIKVNNVAKAVIDNSGIDATYLYNTNLASNTSGLINSTVFQYSETGEPALGSVTLTTIRLNQKVILSFGPDTDTIVNAYRGPNTSGGIDLGGWRVVVTGPGGFSLITRYGHNYGNGPTGEAVTIDTRLITLSAIGTYTFTLYPHRSRSGINEYGWVITNHRIYVSGVFG
jgi:hypothetical protein